MRIVILIPTLHPAGAERVALTLARELARVHQVMLVTYANSHPSSPTAEQSGNWRSHVPPGCAYAHIRPLPGALSHVGRTAALWRLMSKARPDVLISVMTYSNLMAAIVRLLVPFTHVASEHSPFLPGERRRNVIEPLARSLYLKSTVFVGVSHAVVADYVRRSAIKATQPAAVIYNPIDATRIAGMALQRREEQEDVSDALVVVGRLDHHKGPDRVVRALHLVAPEQRPRVAFIGEGTERDALGSLVDELGLRPWVRFAGWQANPYAHMRHSRGVVLASRWEGFGLIVAESAVLGCPFVGVALPAVREVATMVGYQHLCENSLEGLARGLVSIWETPEKHRPSFPLPSILQPDHVAERYLAVATGAERTPAALLAEPMLLAEQDS